MITATGKFPKGDRRFLLAAFPKMTRNSGGGVSDSGSLTYCLLPRCYIAPSAELPQKLKRHF